MNEKGFTAIEMLTIIIILSVAIIFTTPAILKIINSAREEAAIEKSWKVVEAVKSSYLLAQYNGYSEKELGSSITFENNILSVNFSGITPKFNDNIIEIKGEKPKSGTVSINVATNKVTCKNLKFISNGHYTCSTDENGNHMVCCKNKDVCNKQPS